MKKQEYVVSFIFTPSMAKVWLIEKLKPEWQKGLLNGIGGKIEEGELPLEAAYRELKEEAGLTEYKSDLVRVGYMDGTNNDKSSFRVYIYTAVSAVGLKTMEEEKIYLTNCLHVRVMPHIKNVPLLIEVCKYKLTGGSNFSELIMKY